MGRENESLIAKSGSHDQDDMVKSTQNLLPQNRQADFHETWYVAFWTSAHHNLIK